MGLEEGAELDQMILDEDVFLSQLCFTFFEVFLLLTEFFLLVLEGLLYLVHSTALLKETRSR